MPLKMLSRRVVASACSSATTTPLWRVPRCARAFQFPPTSPPTLEQPKSRFADFPLPREMPLIAAEPKLGQLVLKDCGGLSIASLDDQAPVTALAILVPSGSRYESIETLGSGYITQCSAYQSKQGMSTHYIAYESENRGTKLGCSVTRDYMLYTATFLRDQIDFATKLLTGLIMKKNSQYYAYKDALTSSKYFAKSYWENNLNTAIEEIYACAFRHAGLGNPTAMSLAANLPTFEAYTEYAKTSSIIGKESVIAAYGVGIDELNLAAVSALGVENNVHASYVAKAPQATRYYGGSARIARKGANVLIPAFEGARAGDLKDRAVLELISSLALGTAVNHSPVRNTYSRTFENTTSHTLNESFAESGLFGFVIKSVDAALASAEAKRIVDALHQIVDGEHPALAEEDLFEGAKRRAALTYSERTDARRLPATIELARAKAYGYLGQSNITKTILQLKSEDVVSRVKSLLAKGGSFVAVGQIARLPYPDDLRLPIGTSRARASSE